ncbi:heat shock protein 30-like [Chanos chanos]|uniref:Heat shock protein 30-like n=1 Tax=Chanos chanos TaxID=29144 RepID=A0A6J2UWP5_CHACN|nr:heat shock protein 30-like [Chanos chanos]
MLSLHGYQPVFSPLMDLHWPVRSLWPEVTPLYSHRELLLRNMQEMKTCLEQLEKMQHKVFEELDHMPASGDVQPVSYTLDKEGDGFALTLDARDFSPEELSVKQVGRKLQVSGKTEKKQDDGHGSYSYRVQEFRREFDLPEGVSPEAVTCFMADGKLHIQAPKNQIADKPERVVPMDCGKTVGAAVHSSMTEDSAAETQKNQEEKQI